MWNPTRQCTAIMVHRRHHSIIRKFYIFLQARLYRTSDTQLAELMSVSNCNGISRARKLLAHCIVAKLINRPGRWLRSLCIRRTTVELRKIAVLRHVYIYKYIYMLEWMIYWPNYHSEELLFVHPGFQLGFLHQRLLHACSIYFIYQNGNVIIMMHVTRNDVLPC